MFKRKYNNNINTDTPDFNKKVLKILTAKSPCRDLIEGELGKIPIGLITADNICQDLNKTVSPMQKSFLNKAINNTRYILNSFDKCLLNIIQYSGMAIATRTSGILLDTLPTIFENVPYTDVVKGIVYAKAITTVGTSAMNHLFPPQPITPVTPATPPTPPEQRIINTAECMRWYKGDGKCTSIKECRDLYIDVNYTIKGINYNEFSKYIELPDIMYTFSKTRKYRDITKVWTKTLLLAEDSQRDFGIIVFILLNKIHPDDQQHSHWITDVKKVVTYILNYLKSYAEDQYLNCILSLVMLHNSLFAVDYKQFGEKDYIDVFLTDIIEKHSKNNEKVTKLLEDVKKLYNIADITRIHVNYPEPDFK